MGVKPFARYVTEILHNPGIRRRLARQPDVGGRPQRLREDPHLGSARRRTASTPARWRRWRATVLEFDVGFSAYEVAIEDVAGQASRRSEG